MDATHSAWAASGLMECEETKSQNFCSHDLSQNLICRRKPRRLCCVAMSIPYLPVTVMRCILWNFNQAFIICKSLCLFLAPATETRQISGPIGNTLTTNDATVDNYHTSYEFTGTIHESACKKSHCVYAERWCSAKAPCATARQWTRASAVRACYHAIEDCVSGKDNAAMQPFMHNCHPAHMAD